MEVSIEVKLTVCFVELHSQLGDHHFEFAACLLELLHSSLLLHDHLVFLLHDGFGLLVFGKQGVELGV